MGTGRGGWGRGLPGLGGGAAGEEDVAAGGGELDEADSTGGGAAGAEEPVPTGGGAIVPEEIGAGAGAGALEVEPGAAALVEGTLDTADEEAPLGGVEVPEPPPNLPAKHCVMSGTSVSPEGVRERT